MASLLAETHVQPYCAHLDVDVVDDNDVVDHDAVDAVKPSDETCPNIFCAFLIIQYCCFETHHQLMVNHIGPPKHFPNSFNQPLLLLSTLLHAYCLDWRGQMNILG